MNHCSYNSGGTLLASGSDDTRICIWAADGAEPSRRPRWAFAHAAGAGVDHPYKS